MSQRRSQSICEEASEKDRRREASANSDCPEIQDHVTKATRWWNNRRYHSFQGLRCTWPSVQGSRRAWWNHSRVWENAEKSNDLRHPHGGRAVLLFISWYARLLYTRLPVFVVNSLLSFRSLTTPWLQSSTAISCFFFVADISNG